MTLIALAALGVLAWNIYREWTPSAALWCGIGAVASLIHNTATAL